MIKLSSHENEKFKHTRFFKQKRKKEKKFSRNVRTNRSTRVNGFRESSFCARRKKCPLQQRTPIGNFMQMEVARPKREIRILLSAGESARIPQKLGPPCKSRKPVARAACTHGSSSKLRNLYWTKESRNRDGKLVRYTRSCRLETNKLSDHKALPAGLHNMPSLRREIANPA